MKRIGLALAVGLALLALPRPALGQGWYGPEWGYRKKITIDHTMVAGDLTDFPVLLDFTDTDLRDDARTDGWDILFTDSTGTAKLSHDIEDYEGSSGAIVVWVEVDLSGSVDTDIYMYYGYPTISSSEEDETGTWSDSYAAVYHLHDDFYDATGNHDATNGGSTDVTGMAGDGQNFTGDYIDTNWAPSSFTGDFTFEGWFRALTQNGTGDLIGVEDRGGGDNSEIRLAVRDRVDPNSADGYDIEIRPDGGDIISLDAALPGDPDDGNWHHLALVRDGSTGRVYYDGSYISIADSSVSSGTSSFPSPVTILLGAQWSTDAGGPPATRNEFSGDLDELRIHTAMRTEDFFATQVANVNNSSPGGFYDLPTGEETPPPSGNVLMMAAGEPVEDSLQAYLESQGLTVYTIGCSLSASEVGDSVTFYSADVLYISQACGSSSVDDVNIKDLSVGIVMPNVGNWDDFELSNHDAEATGSAYRTGDIIDNSHYITQPFSTGNLTLYSADTPLGWGDNGFGTGADVLMEYPGDSNRGLIVAYETGANLENGDPAAGRRVGFYTESEDWEYFTADTRTLIYRSIIWAAGLDSGGGGGDPAVTSATAEIAPNNVTTSWIGVEFIYAILATISGSETGVDSVEITVPATFGDPTVDSVRVGGSAVSYTDNTSGKLISITLDTKVTSTDSIQVYFTADAPTSSDATGKDFTSTVDDKGTGTAPQSTTEGNADGDAGDNNSWTVTTTDLGGGGGGTPAGICPAVDTVFTASLQQTDSLLFQHTTSGPDRFMLVGLSWNNDNTEVVDWITYNGVALNRIGTASDADDSRIEIWQLVDPDPGTHDVVVKFDQDLLWSGVVGAITFTGAEQADITAMDSLDGDGVSGNTASVSVNSAVGELVFAIMAKEYGDAATLQNSPPAAEQWNQSIPYGDGEAAAATDTGRASVDVSWTWTGSSGHWAAGGVSIAPASACLNAAPTISSNANQTFEVGDPSTVAERIVITEDPSYGTITDANDIRITIPAGLDMIWDTTLTAVTIGGASASKVSATLLPFEDNGKTAVINVTTDFAGGGQFYVDSLKFMDFNSISAADSLELEVGNDDVVSALDDKTKEITLVDPAVTSATAEISPNDVFTNSTGDEFIYAILATISGDATGVDSVEITVPATFGDPTVDSVRVGGSAVTYGDSTAAKLISIVLDTKVTSTDSIQVYFAADAPTSSDATGVDFTSTVDDRSTGTVPQAAIEGDADGDAGDNNSWTVTTTDPPPAVTSATAEIAPNDVTTSWIGVEFVYAILATISGDATGVDSVEITVPATFGDPTVDSVRVGGSAVGYTDNTSGKLISITLDTKVTSTDSIQVYFAADAPTSSDATGVDFTSTVDDKATGAVPQSTTEGDADGDAGDNNSWTVTTTDLGGGGGGAPAGICPAVDTVFTASVQQTDSLLFQHTTTDGPDRFMLVGLSWNNDNTEVVDWITYNGVALNRIGTASDADDSRIEIWQLVDPDPGTHDVVVKFDQDLLWSAVVGAITFTGAEQADITAMDSLDGDGVSGNTASVTVSSAVGELVFAIMAKEYGDAATLQNSPPAVEQWNSSIPYGDGEAAAATDTGRASVDVSWTWTGSAGHWAAGGVSIGSAPACLNAAPTISSNADQTFEVGDPSTVAERIVITEDPSYGTISDANDIRITIPAGLDMIWDTTLTAVTIGGASASKVSATLLPFEDNGKTAVINVTTDFAGGDQFYVDSLKFMNFNSASAADSLELEVGNDDVVSALDDKTKEITGPPPAVTSATAEIAPTDVTTSYIGVEFVYAIRATITGVATGVDSVEITVPATFGDPTVDSVRVGGTSVSYSDNTSGKLISVNLSTKLTSTDSIQVYFTADAPTLADATGKDFTSTVDDKASEATPQSPTEGDADGDAEDANSWTVTTTDIGGGGGGGGVCPAVDDVSTDTTRTDSVSFQHTTSGSDRLMLVGVSLNNQFSEEVDWVTYNGVALSLVGTETGGSLEDDARIEIWQLVDPDPGTHDVVVKFTADLYQSAVVGAITFTGAEQSAITAMDSANGTASNPAYVYVNSQVGDLVFAIMASEYGGGPTLQNSPPAIEQWWRATPTAEGHGAAATDTGRATVYVEWAQGDEHWATGGVSISPSAACLSAVPTISSNADQTFEVGDPSTVAERILITDDPYNGTISDANDIRITIPDGLDMIWDTTLTTVTIGGASASKVSPTLLPFEDNGKTAVINVTTDFGGGDQFYIDSLKFMDFNSISAADSLELEVGNDDVVSAVDDKTKEITFTATAVTSATAEIWPNDVIAGSIDNAFVYAILATIGGSDTGVDSVEITVPAIFGDPTVNDVRVGGVSVGYTDGTSGKVISITLDTKLTSTDSIQVYFSADAPASADAGQDFTSKVDDTGTPVAAQATTEGNADGDAGDANSWTVATTASAPANLIGRYCFNEAASGTGPTQVLDDQASPIHMDITYSGMSWAEISGHRGLGAASHSGIASADANGSKYETTLDGATQATLVGVAEWTGGSADRVIGFMESDGSRLAQILTTSSGVEVRFRTQSQALRLGWSGSWNDGTRRVFHIVYDAANATQTERLRFYVDGVDQGAPTFISGTWPTQTEGLDFSTATVYITALNELDTSNPIPGHVFYFDVRDAALSDAEAASSATALLADDDCGSSGGSAATSAVAEIAPNDVETSSTGNEFIYSILATINTGGGDTGVDRVEIPVPASFGLPTVDSVRVGGTAVSYTDNTSGRQISFDLDSKLTSTDSIQVYFTANAPTSADATGQNFTSMVDDTATATSPQATTEGNGDGDGGDNNSWTVTTTDPIYAVTSATAEIAPNDVVTSSTGNEFIYAILATISGAATGVDSVEITVPATFGDPTVDSVRVGGTAVTYGDSTAAKLISIVLDTKVTSTDSIQVYFTADAPTSSDATGVDFTSTVDDKSTGTGPQATTEGDADGDSGDNNSWTVTTSGAVSAATAEIAPNDVLTSSTGNEFVFAIRATITGDDSGVDSVEITVPATFGDPTVDSVRVGGTAVTYTNGTSGKLIAITLDTKLTSTDSIQVYFTADAPTSSDATGVDFTSTVDDKSTGTGPQATIEGDADGDAGDNNSWTVTTSGAVSSATAEISPNDVTTSWIGVEFVYAIRATITGDDSGVDSVEITVPSTFGDPTVDSVRVGGSAVSYTDNTSGKLISINLSTKLTSTDSIQVYFTADAPTLADAIGKDFTSTVDDKATEATPQSPTEGDADGDSGDANSWTVITTDIGGGGGGGGVCPAVDNVTTDTTSTDIVSFQHTTSGSDRLMLVGVSINNEFYPEVDWVTYNGVPLSLIGAENGGSDGDDARVEIWQLVDPDPGTHDVVVQFTEDLYQSAVVGAITFTGAEQTAITAMDSAAGIADSFPYVDVSSQVGDLVFAVLSKEYGDWPILQNAPPAIEQWMRAMPTGSAKAGAATDTGRAIVHIEWVQGQDHWATGGVSISPSAACLSAVPTISSNADQTFGVGDPSTVAERIVITDDPYNGTISDANDIRITIPDGLDMIWDTTLTAVTIGGASASKVSPTLLPFEDNGKTAVINVTTDFGGGDQFYIDSLKFMDFNSVSAADSLELEVGNDDVVSAVDDKTKEIIYIEPAVTSATAEISPNDVITSSTANEFVYAILATITGDATGVDSVEITVPATFGDPTVDSVRVGGSAVAYGDSTAAKLISIVLDTKVTSTDSIQVYFTADAPTSSDATGVDFTSTVDDGSTGTPPQATTEGDADGDAGDNNSWTVTTSGAVSAATAEISPNDVTTNSTGNEFVYAIRATITGDDSGVDSVEITVPATFGDPTVDSVRVGGTAVSYGDSTAAKLISIVLDTKVTSTDSIQVYFTADAPTSPDGTGVDFTSTVDDKGTGTVPQATTEGDADGDAGDANSWTVTTTDPPDAVTSATAEIWPNDVIAGSIDNAFVYAILATIGGSDTGVDSVEITVPAIFGDPTVNDVRVGGVSVGYTDGTSGKIISITLASKLTSTDSIQVYFSADAPSSADAGQDFTSKVDDTGTGVAAQSTTEGNADGDAGDNNSWTVATTSSAPANLIGRYCFNEAASGTGPTQVLDDQASPVHMDITYNGMSWAEISGHRGLGAASHSGIASADANGSKYETTLDGATQATLVGVAEWTGGASDRVIGFMESDGSRLAQILTTSSGVEVRFRTQSQALRLGWSGSWNDGTRRVFHIVYDAANATQTERLRFYVDGVDQGAPTFISGTWPTQTEGLDFSTATVYITALNELDTSNPIPGHVFYFDVRDAALSDAEAASSATALLADDDCGGGSGGSAATSAVAEIAPNDVETSSTGNEFIYSILATINTGGGDTGVDRVEIPVPASFGLPTVDSVRVGGTAVSYTDNTSGRQISFDLDSKLTTTDSIQVYFTADAPTSPDATGQNFTSMVDDTATATSPQATTEGNGDGDAGDNNSWTVTTTDPIYAVASATAEISPNDVVTSSTGNEFIYAILATISGDATGVDSVEITVPATFGDPTVDSVRVGGTAVSYGDSTAAKLISIVLDTKVTSTDSIQVYFTADAPTSSDATGVDFTSTVDDKSTGEGPQATTEGDADGDAGDNNSWTVTTSGAVSAATAEIAPNDVLTSSTGNEFIYAIRATITGDDSGVDSVEITVPATFGDPTVDSVRVGGTAAGYTDGTSGKLIAITLDTKVTSTDSIQVYFTADAPTSPDGTGVDFTSTVDDKGTGAAPQATTEGDADGDAGDANSWTVTTSAAVSSATAEISPNDVETSSTGNEFVYAIRATISGDATGVDSVEITVPSTFGDPTVDSVRVGGSAVSYTNGTSGKLIAITLDTKLTSTDSIQIYFTADAPTSPDGTGVDFTSTVDDRGTGAAPQATSEGDADGDAGDANSWTVTTTDALAAPLVRYWIDEAPSGQGVTYLLDSEASPINVPLSYVDSVPYFAGDHGGFRHLRFNGPDGDDTGGGLVDVGSTKLDPVHGSTAVTMEVKYAFDPGEACNGDDDRIFGIADGRLSESGQLLMRDYGARLLAVKWQGDASTSRYELVGGCTLLTTASVVHWVIDTNESTASDRVRAYVNGVRQTVTEHTGTWPSQGATIDLGVSANRKMMIGRPYEGQAALRGRIWYAALYLGEMSEAEISTQAAALAASDDNNTYPVTVTPDGAGPEVKQTGTEYSYNFTLNNGSSVLEDFDLLASTDPASSFITIDSITGGGISDSGVADSARITGVAAGADSTVTVWYTVATDTDGNRDTLYLRGRSMSDTTETDLGWVEIEYDAPLTPLVRYWIDEAPSGQGVTNLLDAESNPLNMPLSYPTTSPYWAGSLDGGGNRHLRFSGTSGSNTGGGVVDINGTKVDAVQGATSITIEVKYMMDAATACTGEDSRIFGISDGDNSADGWLAIRERSYRDILQVRWQSQGLGEYALETGCPITSASVVHWVIDTENATASDRVRAYIDGVRATVTPIESTSFPAQGETIDLGPNTRRMYIGRAHSGVRTLNGRIWYAALYEGVMDAAQITANVAAINANDDQYSYAVTTTPDGSAVVRLAGSYSYDFNLNNGSSVLEDFDLFASTDPASSFIAIDSITGGGISSSGVPDSTRITGVEAAADSTVTVWYTITADTEGNVDTLYLEGRSISDTAQSDLGWIEIEYETMAFTVTPDGADTLQLMPTGSSASSSYKFTITNSSGVSETFDLLAFDATVLTIDSITGPNVSGGSPGDSARTGAIAASTADSAFVWFTISIGTAGALDSLYLMGRSVSEPSATDSGWVFVELLQPDLATSKLVNPNGTQPPGTDLTYTATVTNNGTADAVDVVTVDSLPSELYYKVGTESSTLPSGMTDDIEFYDGCGSDGWSYTPVSGGGGAPAGYDACVLRIRWTLLDDLSYVAPDNTAELEFVARIK